MPTSISLCHPDPTERFRKTLDDALISASTADAAIAFITQSGVDYFMSWAERLRPERCRLTVSVHFPTDLDALCALSSVLEDRLRIYLGTATPKEKLSLAVPLLHSKILHIENEAGNTTTFVGSHNWTAPALDGMNFEASVRVECTPGDAFVSQVKRHLDACFTASDTFDPADLQFYKALQREYFPKRPEQPERDAVREFVRVPEAPAVVIHAEDHRPHKTPRDLLLYLPLAGSHPHDWFDPIARTRIYLYLYPPGTLLEKQPPSALPFLYEGQVTTFGHAENPILGQRVTCQIRELRGPILEDAPGENIPVLLPGVEAQVVGELMPCEMMRLPVYHWGNQPAVQVQARCDEQESEEHTHRHKRLLTRMPDDRDNLPATLLQHYTSDSVVFDELIFRRFTPLRALSLSVPGSGLYPQPVKEIVREVLGKAAGEGQWEPDITEIRNRYDYIYQVKYVLAPPPNTHGR